MLVRTLRALKPQWMRFWSKVDKNGPTPAHCSERGPCWLWIGGNAQGYGRFRLGRKTDGMIQAHRWSLEQELGRRIPEDKMVCHHCDNPRCVNPGHLYEGTGLDNERDKRERGRHSRQGIPPEKLRRGEANNKAKITEANVRFIRSREWIGTFTQSELARELGVTPTIVSRVLSNKIWRHVDANV